MGFGFTGPGGDSLLSSVAATLRVLHPEDFEKRIQVLRRVIRHEIRRRRGVAEGAEDDSSISLMK